MIEAHFGVPMTGAVLNTLNTRLDAEAIAFMLDHGEAKVLLTDTEFAPTMRATRSALVRRKPLVIDVVDALGPGGERRSARSTTKRSSRKAIPASRGSRRPTSGRRSRSTTPRARPATRRASSITIAAPYLNALSNIIDWGMPRHPVYLWTLPMFHCNGWCFPWTMAANAGTNVCLRKVEAKAIFDAIREHRVTHYCGAPIVHSLLINAPDEMKQGIAHKVSGAGRGAAPPAAMIEGMERMGFDITHVYGLTETYGPAAVCAKHDGVGRRSTSARAPSATAARACATPLQEGMTVMDPETMQRGAARTARRWARSCSAATSR